MSVRGLIHRLRYPNAVQHIIAPRGTTKLPPHLVGASALRRRPTSHPNGLVLASDQSPKRGMWVSYQGRTGILTDLEPGDVATVMLVDDRGHNVMAIHVPAKELRQAWHEEIPLPRRPALKDAVLFGYHARP